MTNFKDMDSVVRAKRNEVESKGLDQYYGDSRNAAVDKAYNAYASTSRDKLAGYLEETKVPRYVRLAKFLREIYTVNTDYEKAKVVLKDKDNRYGIYGKKVKTTYKEFKQIEKRARKVSKKNAAKLNKFKDVKNFIQHDLDNVLFELESKSLGRFDTIRLTEFFDNCDELKFLRHSKLTKNVK